METFFFKPIAKFNKRVIKPIRVKTLNLESQKNSKYESTVTRKNPTYIALEDIKRIRDKYKLTQEKLAEELGVGQVTVAR